MRTWLRRSRLPVWLVGLVAFAVASPALALTLAPMTLGEMTDNASVVVRAKCVDRTVTRTSLGSIESLARFQVIEAAKGTPPEIVIVRQLGGTLEGTTTVVPGAPLSEPGDEVVLFLEPARSGDLQVVGLALGYMPVVSGSAGREVVAVSPHLGAGFEKGGTRPVDELLTRVRRLARKAP